MTVYYGAILTLFLVLALFEKEIAGGSSLGAGLERVKGIEPSYRFPDRAPSGMPR